MHAGDVRLPHHFHGHDERVGCCGHAAQERRLCCWVSSLGIMSLVKFRVPSLVHVAPGAHFLPAFSPSYFFVAAALRDVLLSLRLNQPELDLPSLGAECVSCDSASGVYDGISRQRGEPLMTRCQGRPTWRTTHPARPGTMRLRSTLLARLRYIRPSVQAQKPLKNTTNGAACRPWRRFTLCSQNACRRSLKTLRKSCLDLMSWGHRGFLSDVCNELCFLC